MTRIIALAVAALISLPLAAQARMLGIGTETPQQFVEAAAIYDMYEIEASKVALERSQNPEVKKFAQDIINTHGPRSEALKTAIQTGAAPAAPTAMDSDHQDMVEKLRTAEGDKFDRLFLRQQANTREDTIEVFERYAANGENPALKAYATQVLPNVKTSMTKAEGLLQTVRSASK